MEGAFLAAALRGDQPELKELLAKGCPVNAKNEVKSLHTLVCLHSDIIKQHASIV